VTTTNALMQAVLRHPADDLPRLLYADELDAAGECERAEFVRVQIELAKWEMYPGERFNGFSHEGKRYEFTPTASLIAREKELLHLEYKREIKLIAEVIGYQGNLISNFVTYRRGFPSAISLPMALLMGGECERCGGYGHTELFPYFKCPPCHGTGRVPGLIDTIFSQWPVETVTVSDKQPMEFRASSVSGWRWICNRYVPGADEIQQGLPTVLYDRLVKSCKTSFGHNEREAFYPTRDAALLALSHAIVDLGRPRTHAGRTPRSDATGTTRTASDQSVNGSSSSSNSR
jgi:uncharacterized protein (TIGR02996 family)